jgi:cell division septation protein DedD
VKPSEKTIAKKSTPTLHAKNSENFGIQVGSFPNRAEANTVLKALEKKSVDGEVIVAKVGGKTRFRLVVPGFPNRKEAEDKAKKLKAQSKIDSFVIIKI